MSKKMKAVQISKPGGDFEVVERNIPEPGAGQVRVKVEAGPFMCAGVTVYNALRNSGARGGDVVAVHGIGGLGHLGVQYARQMGFQTVALGRGKDKGPLAKKLGAHRYIDTGHDDVVAE